MTIESKLRTYVLESFLFSDDASLLNNSDSFMETGILDSSGIVDIILFVQEEFGIRIPNEDAIPENLDSIDQLLAYITTKTSA